MRNQLFIGAAILALAVPATVQAQQITSGIEGRVTDETGAAVAGAEVTVTDTRTGAKRVIATNEVGAFSAEGLTSGGPYTVSASAAGLEGQTLEGVITTVQGATSLTFTLVKGGGDIVVTASRVKLTQLAVGPGTSFGKEQLANAPSFNRDIRDIIRIDPRVSLDRDDGGSGVDRISCLGGNDRGNTFTVDGTPQSDVYGLNDTGFSSRSSTPLPFDAIREAQVQFAPYDVEYGQFTGCAINVITKSGSNSFHGGGFFEYSDSSLRGKRLPGVGGVGTVPVAPITPERRYGLSLGGPIIPDRLFFYGAYEHQEAGQSQDDGPANGGYANPQLGITVQQFNDISAVLSSVYGIETGPLVTSRDYTNDRYFGRLDWQINDQHRLEATYQRLEEGTVRPDDLFTGSSPQAIGRNTFYISGTKSNYYSGRFYSQWNDSFSTELRYARSEIRDRQDPIGGGEAQDAVPIPRIIVGIDNPSGDNTSTIDGAVLAGPGNSRSANDLRTTINQYRALAKLTAGNHKFKLGFEVNQASLYNVFVQNATGTLVFRNIADLRAGLLSPGVLPPLVGGVRACTSVTQTTTPVNVINGCTTGAFGNFAAGGDINNAAAIFNRSIYSVYAQDDWTLSDQLKVVIGLRTDWYSGGHPNYNPIFRQRYGITNATGFNALDPVLLPRIGFTYDFDDGGIFARTQLRGGAGLFSGGDPLVWFGNVFQNDGTLFGLGTTAAAGCPTGQISVVSGGRFTGVPTCAINAGATLAAAGQGNTQSIDPNIKSSTVVRLNLGLQTQLNLGSSGFFSAWNLNLDYIYSLYRNPYNLVDLAQVPDIRRGLNGFTIDGRPLYSSIDLLAPGCTGRLTGTGSPPSYTGITAACYSNARGAELQLTNAGNYRSHNASILLSKNFKGGLITDGGSTFFSVGYAFTDSHDRRNLYNSTAGSNYGQTAAFDRQNPAASTGFYQSKHNVTVTLNLRNEFFTGYGTTLGFTYVGREGRPYSLTFSGNGIFSSTSGLLTTNDNALLYVPTGINDPNLAPATNPAGVAAIQDLVNFVNNTPCAAKYKGRTIPRNTCTNSWFNDMDLTFSQELPGPMSAFGLGRADKIKLYGTIDNFLNLIDRGSNLNLRRNFFGAQDVARTSGVDAQGRYVITPFTGTSFAADNLINVSSSVWRIKFGVSYDF